MLFCNLHMACARIHIQTFDISEHHVSEQQRVFPVCSLKFFNMALSLFSPLSFPSVNLAAVISAGLADLQQEDGNIWILFCKIIPLRSYLPCWHTHKTVRAETPIAAPRNITSVLFFYPLEQQFHHSLQFLILFCKAHLRLLEWLVIALIPEVSIRCQTCP